MTDYASMTIDNLISYRDQWPAQRTEWNRAELALQKRLAVRDAYLDLAEELREEGIELIQPESDFDICDRGLAGNVMDALWPVLGGNHTPADLWQEISFSVCDALGPYSDVGRSAAFIQGEPQ